VPSALRRAVAFIEAHAAEPVTLTQMAEAAGVAGRALQLAFGDGRAPLISPRRT